MGAKFEKHGDPRTLGTVGYQEERHQTTGERRWRVHTPRLENILLSREELFDLTDLLDDLCDDIEDEEQ